MVTHAVFGFCPPERLPKEGSCEPTAGACFWEWPLLAKLTELLRPTWSVAAEVAEREKLAWLEACADSLSGQISELQSLSKPAPQQPKKGPKPNHGDWPQIQIVLAKIIQNRAQFLTDHDLFDEAPEQPPPCEDSISVALPSRVQARSKRFPLFRVFHAPSPDTPFSKLSFQQCYPLFNSGTIGSWNWGRNVWAALQQYWGQMTVTWPNVLPEVECTPWVGAAIDSALICGPQTFAIWFVFCALSRVLLAALAISVKTHVSIAMAQIPNVCAHCGFHKLTRWLFVFI